MSPTLAQMRARLTLLERRLDRDRAIDEVVADLIKRAGLDLAIGPDAIDPLSMYHAKDVRPADCAGPTSEQGRG